MPEVSGELKVRAVVLLLGLAMQMASWVAMAVVFSELWEARAVARDQYAAMLRALTQAPARLPAWLFDVFVPDEASVRGRLIWNSLFFAAIGIGLQWLACRRGGFYMQAGVPVLGAVLNTGLCVLTVREAILPAGPWPVRYDGGFRFVRYAIRKSGARRVTAVLLVVGVTALSWW
jgi:hypothetical protein